MWLSDSSDATSSFLFDASDELSVEKEAGNIYMHRTVGQRSESVMMAVTIVDRSASAKDPVYRVQCKEVYCGRLASS